MQDERMTISYLRLSKEDGDSEAGSDNESFSIGSQRECIRQYIAQHSDLGADVEEITDDGFSGTNLNRPGMKSLLELVRYGKVKTIIVRDLSRFARNYLDAGHYLEFVFPACQVRFISINDGYDSGPKGDMTGGFNLAIKNLMNQIYSREISRKIKSTVDYKKREGEYVYGTAPYGYKKGEERNTIVIDEYAAGVVRRIYTMVSEGYTIRRVATILNEERIETPSMYLSKVRGNYKVARTWTYESIRNILDNRIYTGDTEPFKSRVVRIGSDLVNHISFEEREIIKNTHEPIVSHELYDDARGKIKRIHGRTIDRNAQNGIFTSLLVCGNCGRRLFKGKKTNKDYLCTARRFSAETECSSVRIGEKNLAEVILNEIQRQCQLIDAQAESRIVLNAQAEDATQAAFKELRSLNRRIEVIKAEKIQRYEKYAEGGISKSDYLSAKSALVREEEDLKLRIEIIKQRITSFEEQRLQRVRQIARDKGIDQYMNIKELTPEIVKRLVKKIVVYPDNRIQIKWNYNEQSIFGSLSGQVGEYSNDVFSVK